jgi:hypothetical protein
MLQRNAGGLRAGERKAGIVEALIGEMRAAVVPRPDAVGAGKSAGILALIGQVARLGNEKDGGAG